MVDALSVISAAVESFVVHPLERGGAVFSPVPLRLGEKFEFLVGFKPARIAEYVFITVVAEHYRCAVETPSSPSGVVDNKEPVGCRKMHRSNQA